MATAAMAMSRTSNTTVTVSIVPTASTAWAVPACSPKGSPAVRLTTQVAMKARLARTVSWSHSLLGRARMKPTKAIWNHPEAAKPQASSDELLAWIGAITRWMAPAAADSDASSTRAGMLRSNASVGSTSGASSVVDATVPPSFDRRPHATVRFLTRTLVTRVMRDQDGKPISAGAGAGATMPAPSGGRVSRS